MNLHRLRQLFCLFPHSNILLATRKHHSRNCHIRIVLDLVGLKVNRCIFWFRICRCHRQVDLGEKKFNSKLWSVFIYTWMLFTFFFVLSLLCWRVEVDFSCWMGWLWRTVGGGGGSWGCLSRLAERVSCKFWGRRVGTSCDSKLWVPF